LAAQRDRSLVDLPALRAGQKFATLQLICNLDGGLAPIPAIRGIGEERQGRTIAPLALVRLIPNPPT
jgi:hypothetical protein